MIDVKNLSKSFGSNVMRSLRDIPTTAIVDANIQMHRCGVTSNFFSLFDRLHKFFGKDAPIAHHMKPHAGFEQRFCLLLETGYKEIEKSINLFSRTIPVFTGKGEHREMFDSAAPRRLDNGSNRFHASSMSFDARQKATLSPTAVAVHNDCEVVRMRHGGL